MPHLRWNKPLSKLDMGRQAFVKESCGSRCHTLFSHLFGTRLARRASARHLRIYREDLPSGVCYMVDQLSSNNCFVNKHCLRKGFKRRCVSSSPPLGVRIIYAHMLR